MPGEDASLRTITADLYETFVSIFTNARPHLDRDRLITEYGAQIYVAKKAEELGYIDVADTNYDAALTALVQEAKISAGQPYQVLTIEPPRPFLADLTGSKLALLSGKMTHHFQINASMNSELSGRFLYLYQPN
jgi:ClpP class serine protease